MTTVRSKGVPLLTGLVSLALAITACGGGGSGGPNSTSGSKPVSQSAMKKALNTPTTLTFWSWVPHLQDEVNLFEKAYPKIHVKLVNAGTGAAQYTKLRTVLKAGKGQPDVVQIEYQYLSSFTLGNNLMNLGPYGASKLKSRYPAWVWRQVSKGGAVYGIPQDTGPMGLLYRKDTLAANGIPVPKTWADFANAAHKLHAKHSNQYLADMPGNDAGQFIGFIWQSGAHPFSYDGKKTVSINLTSPQAMKVVTYWQKLIQDGVIATDADFNNQWYQGLSSGKYASWPTAAWGPVFLQGTAKNTSGKWRATFLPQWTAGAHASGNWGGSTDAVLTSTNHKIAAATLAQWINTNSQSAMDLATKQFLFPTQKATLNNSSFINQKPAFYGGQQVNKIFVTSASHVNTNFDWLPFIDYVYSDYGDTLGKAIADKGNMTAALKKWQNDLVTYAKQQGFTVK